MKVLLKINPDTFIKFSTLRKEYNFAFYYDDPDNVWPTHLVFETESALTWFLLKNPL
jgi:hypothetical protein